MTTDRRSVHHQEWRYLREDLKVNRSILIRILLINYRAGRALERAGTPGLAGWLAHLLYRIIFNLVVIPLGGGELHARCDIGPGIRFPHRLNGIVLHPAVTIGRNVTIYHEVTIGSTGLRNGVAQVPTLGDDVTVYPGAKILGAITVGDRATIGANAVVVESVAPAAIVLAPKARTVSRLDGHDHNDGHDEAGPR